jgi:hypothetical protein
MNVGANPNYMGAYGSISGVVINADLDHDDNDDDDDDDNQYYYTSYSNPSPSPGARVKKGGEGGGEGGLNSATSPSNDPDDRLQRSREVRTSRKRGGERTSTVGSHSISPIQSAHTICSHNLLSQSARLPPSIVAPLIAAESDARQEDEAEEEAPDADPSSQS